MTNNNTRDIIHELANVLSYLGDDYTLTGVECDPGDSAVRVIKRNSDKTLYIVAYSDPDDTEMIMYDETDSVMAECTIYNGAIHDLPAEDFADGIRKFF